MNEIDPKALFRLSVLGPIVSRERLEHGELQQLTRELATREYAMPGTQRRHLGEKTIQAWYYAWRTQGIAGLVPKDQPLFFAIEALILLGTVFSAVHHAEVVGNRVGEPFGSIILAVSVTIIEVGLIVALMLAASTLFVVDQRQVAVVYALGEIKEVITEPGLHFKLPPPLQNVNYIDKRLLTLDSPDNEPMLTAEKQRVVIDWYVRWRITDPLQFLIRMRDERSAQSRLDDIIGSNTMSTVANHDLIELIRTDKNRKVNPSALPAGTEAAPLISIREGRIAIEELILKQAQPVVKEFGHMRSGLVLVTGPTGSGKSTTLAALLDYINTNFRRHIITIEDPIEFVHPVKKSVIVHREVGEHTASFAAALKGATGVAKGFR